MDLVERYLAAVARELPEAQRDDIVAELRDILLSQVEEKEAELGRPLERAEVEALLVGFGNPLVVAFRYRRFQRLIGPDVFPFYLKALKVVVTIAVAIQLIVFAVRLARGVYPWAAIGGLLDQLFFGLVWAVGAVTLVFTLIDHSGGSNALARWRPRHLPPAYIKRSKGGFEIAFDTVVDILFIAWWTGAISFSNTLPGPSGPFELSLAPVWERFYGPVLAVPLLSLASNLLIVLRPGWTRIAAGGELAAAGYATILAFVLLGAGPWVTISSEALGSAAAVWRASLVNVIVFWALLGVGIVHALEALAAGRRLFSGSPPLGLGAPAL